MTLVTLGSKPSGVGRVELTSDGRLELTVPVHTLTDEQKCDIDRAARALNLVVRYTNG